MIAVAFNFIILFYISVPPAFLTEIQNQETKVIIINRCTNVFEKFLTKDTTKQKNDKKENAYRLNATEGNAYLIVIYQV